MEDNNNKQEVSDVETETERELPQVSSSAYSEISFDGTSKKDEEMVSLPEQQAALIPQLEILLQKLQLSTNDITDVMRLVLSKLQKVEEAETKIMQKKNREVSVRCLGG